MVTSMSPLGSLDAHGVPGRPGAGECLIHQFPRGVLVTDAGEDSPQAVIGGAAIELREVRLLGPHAHPTHDRGVPITCRLADLATDEAPVAS